MSARRPEWVFGLGLAGLCLLVFAPGLTSELIHYDDGVYLTGNPVMLIPGWEGLREIWSSERAWRGLFVEFFPLRDTVYWVIRQTWGLAGTPYHLASLGFHIAASLLVYRLLERLDPSGWVARFGALLFAVHPIHVESVTWAASLKDPMYTALLLGSVLAYLKYRELKRPLHYALCLGLLVAALLVKSMALVAPLLLVALERLQAQPTPWRLVVLRVMGPAAISALFTAQFIGIGLAKELVGQPHGGTWESHWVLAAWAQARYLQQAFVPSTFELIECFSPAQGFTDPRFFAGLAALGLAVVMAVVWRKQPLRLFFLGWYFINLLPVSNLVPFPAVMADRYLYAASVSVCWLLASLMDTHVVRFKSVLAGAVLLTLGLTTAYRSSFWQHEDDLWAATDEDPVCLVDPGFPAAQVHLVRSWTAPTRELQLAALERGLASPAYSRPGEAARCDVLVPAIPLALGFGQREKALEWARQAIRACPRRGDAWNAAMMTTLHRAPGLAHAAAEQAAIFEPSPLNLMLRALTSLEVKAEEATAAEVKAAVQLSPEGTCPALTAWRSQVSPELAAGVADAAALCPGGP